MGTIILSGLEKDTSIKEYMKGAITHNNYCYKPFTYKLDTKLNICKNKLQKELTIWAENEAELVDKMKELIKHLEDDGREK